MGTSLHCTSYKEGDNVTQHNRIPWPQVALPAHITFHGPWEPLTAFGWTLLERQPEPVYAKRFKNGKGVLGLTVDRSALPRCRLLASRAGLHTKHASTPPHATLEPFTLKEVAETVSDAPERRIHVVHAPTGLYVAVDNYSMSLERALYQHKLPYRAYYGARGLILYFPAWADLAKGWRRSGYTIRPAYGYPHDAIPFRGQEGRTRFGQGAHYPFAQACQQAQFHDPFYQLEAQRLQTQQLQAQREEHAGRQESDYDQRDPRGRERQARIPPSQAVDAEQHIGHAASAAVA